MKTENEKSVMLSLNVQKNPGNDIDFRKSESRLFLVFFSSFVSLFLSELVLKLLEIVTKPSRVSSFAPLLLCVCQ